MEEEKKGKSIRVEPVIAENLATVSSSLSIIDSSPIRLSPTPHARVLTVGSRFRNSIRHRISSPIQQSVPFQSYAQEQIVKRPPSWLIAIRWRVRKRFRNMFLILRATLNLRSRWWRVDFVLRWSPSSMKLRPRAWVHELLEVNLRHVLDLFREGISWIFWWNLGLWPKKAGFFFMIHTPCAQAYTSSDGLYNNHSPWAHHPCAHSLQLSTPLRLGSQCLQSLKPNSSFSKFLLSSNNFWFN